MKITVEMLNIIFFLLPGLISLIIINSCLVKKVTDVFDKIILSLILSALNFIIINSFNNNWSFISIEKLVNGFNLKISSYQLVVEILLLSIFSALIISFLVNKDLHMMIFRLLKITSLTSRNSTWVDIFEEEQRYILIHLNDGRLIQGYPLYYSTKLEEERIYLINAKWLVDGEYIDLNSEGILINGNIDMIEFLKNEGENNEKSK